MQTFKAILVGVLITIVAVAAFTVGRATNSDRVRALVGQIDSLAEGWVKAQAVIVSQGEMNDRLKAEAKTLDAKYRKAAGENIALKLQLDRIIGGGPGEIIDPGQPQSTARYQDKIVQLEYHIFDGDFAYIVKERPIVLSLVQQGDGITANAYDPDLERQIGISKLDYYKVPAKKKWYQNFGIAPGAGWDQDGWKVGIKPRIQLWHLPIEARLEKEGIKWSAALYRDLW